MSQLPGSLLHPCLRPLEAIPFEAEGERRIAWRDPVGLAATVEVAGPVAFLMSLMNGRPLEAVRGEWKTLTGEELPLSFLQDLVTQLDRHLLLDGPSFRAARRAALAEYRRQAHRPMAHCDGGYPETAAECGPYLDDLLRRGAALCGPCDGPVRGLVAPHIDLHRGGLLYGAAYERLRRSTADLFIVLGVAHSSGCWPDPPPLATLTRLDYATPFGLCRTEGAFIDDLLRRYDAAGGDPEDLFRDELVHRDEHSLEFQMLFLAHLHGHRPFKVVPLLAGSLHAFYDSPDDVAGRAGLGPLVTALRAAIDAWPGEVCVVAGADLSHVGPRFGDEQPVGPTRVQQVKAGDRAALALLADGPEPWFGHFAADHNARNVCSVSNLYLVRALLPQAELSLLRHEVAYDPQQTVSFAAATLH